MEDVLVLAYWIPVLFSMYVFVMSILLVVFSAGGTSTSSNLPSVPALPPVTQSSAPSMRYFFRFFSRNTYLIWYYSGISQSVHFLKVCLCMCFQYLREIGTCSGEGSSFTPRNFCGFCTVPLSHTAGQSRTGATHRGHQWATLLLLLLIFAEYFTQMHLKVVLIVSVPLKACTLVTVWSEVHNTTY